MSDDESKTTNTCNMYRTNQRLSGTYHHHYFKTCNEQKHSIQSSVNNQINNVTHKNE